MRQRAAIARRFAAEGAEVIITDVLDTKGKAWARELPRATYHHLDVSSEGEWLTLVEAVVDRHGKADILVNNAGVFTPSSIRDTSLELWERHYRVVLLGVSLGMKAVIEPMIVIGGGSDRLACCRASSIHRSIT